MSATKGPSEVDNIQENSRVFCNASQLIQQCRRELLHGPTGVTLVSVTKIPDPMTNLSGTLASGG